MSDRVNRTVASGMGIAAVLVLALGCGGGSSPGASGVVPSSGTSASASPGNARVASLPLGSVTSSSVDVASGATAVEVTSADLPGQLLTAITPGYSGVRPSLATDSNGIVHVTLPQAAGGGGPSRVVVVLNRAVTWSIFLTGGASAERVNMRDAKVNVVDLAAGASQAHITLPRPTGTDLLRMTGGASRLMVDVPRGSPTRVQVKGGASSVRIGTTTHTGIGQAVTYDAAGYATAQNRIDVEIDAGVSALSVQPY